MKSEVACLVVGLTLGYCVSKVKWTWKEADGNVKTSDGEVVPTYFMD